MVGAGTPPAPNEIIGEFGRLSPGPGGGPHLSHPVSLGGAWEVPGRGRRLLRRPPAGRARRRARIATPARHQSATRKPVQGLAPAPRTPRAGAFHFLGTCCSSRGSGEPRHGSRARSVGATTAIVRPQIGQFSWSPTWRCDSGSQIPGHESGSGGGIDGPQRLRLVLTPGASHGGRTPCGIVAPRQPLIDPDRRHRYAPARFTREGRPISLTTRR